MLKWFSRQSAATKVMVILIIALLIGIIIRWDYVSREMGDAFGRRFGQQDTEQTE